MIWLCSFVHDIVIGQHLAHTVLVNWHNHFWVCFFFVIDVFIHVALKTTWVWRLNWYMNSNWVLWCSVLYGMTKQKSSVWKKKQKSFRGKKTNTKAKGGKFQGKKAKKININVIYFSSKKTARHYTNETL